MALPKTEKSLARKIHTIAQYAYGNSNNANKNTEYLAFMALLKEEGFHTSDFNWDGYSYNRWYNDVLSALKKKNKTT
jgi:hypothetical protein